MRPVATSLVLCALCAAADSAHAAATFEVRNITDAAGVGFNDQTPVIPEGGNTATTLGEARLKVLQEAGRIWGNLLVSSVPIVVDARGLDLTCGSGPGSSTTLASAGPRAVYRPQSGPQQNIYFPAALAESLAGTNLSDPGDADIRVTLNLLVNNNVSCASGARFYHGFDHNPGSLQIDLLQVLLHELGHGLGFGSLVDLNTGEGISEGTPPVERLGSFDQYIFDESLGLAWPALTAQQRLQSAVRSGSLAWNGTNANNSRQRYTDGITAGNRMRLHAPATISTGSSVSHWDIALTPNALMEPFLTSTNGFTDLTPCVLKDIGWAVTRCFDGANAVPVPQNQTITAVEDTPISIVLGASDTDGDPLTFAVSTAPAKGALSALSTTLPISTLFTPNSNANGSDTFTFTASDGNATSAVATVTISITAVNDAPAAVARSATVQAGQSVGITLSGSDVDGDPLSFAVITNPVSGAIGGSPPNITYTPNSGFSGADSFTYRASDATAFSPTVTVSITVTPAPNTGGGGGGGATGLPLLALLGSLLAYARLRAARATS